MHFEITHSDDNCAARSGVLHTAHGPVSTPVFMPVGTLATVKAMRPDVLRELGAEIILGNTYHLALRPGPQLIETAGGLHRFMAWDGAILTDSGGFQLYSMSGRHKVGEDGVSFQSHLDGSRHFISPEDCVAIQHSFGSDVIMVLDHCLPYPSPDPLVREAMELTCRWAARSAEEHSRRPGDLALFAIQQGGFDSAMRGECSRRLADIGFDGYAVGGLSVGEPNGLLRDTAALAIQTLPPDKPHYLMGVGPPEDLLHMISLGFDMFDCVIPTRSARTGLLYTSRGKLVIKNARYRDDLSPPDPDCDCYVCRNFTRAYLRHLFTSGEILSAVLNTHHNLHFFLGLMSRARAAIEAGEFLSFKNEFETRYSIGTT